MSKLPMKIMVDGTCGFYLRPRGCAGSEAILYLPAYNDYVRNRLVRKGYRLLSEAYGDFSEGGENSLVIRPPSDETIYWMLGELESRVKATTARLKDEIAEAKEAAEDAEGDMRRLYRTRIRQLERELKNVGTQTPTFEQAKLLFIRVHRAAIARGIQPSVREALAQLSEEQRWAFVESELNEKISEGEPVPA